MTTQCFHCAEPVPDSCQLSVRWQGTDEPVCCAGCQAVAEFILSGGESDYYRYRDQAASRVDQHMLAELERWEAFDNPTNLDDDIAKVQLLVGGIHCSACVWLIEKQLQRLPGVVQVRVDQSSGQSSIQWHPDQIKLSQVLQQLVRLGYQPHPLDNDGVDQRHHQERNDLLKRVLVAGLGMMQTMMYAIATWVGPDQGIDPAIMRLLMTASLLITTPVIFYAGAPLIVGAVRSLQARQPSMDVPVTLALLLAFGASCVNYFHGSDQVYFESATMFVFLLLCARFVAMTVRHRSAEAQLALVPMLPDTVVRVRDPSDNEHITRAELRPGDLILVRPGDAFAADGQIETGHTHVNEALLSGESAAQPRTVDDLVLAGSLNLDGAVTVRVNHTGQQTRLAQMAAMLGSAQTQRPAKALLANQVASWFVIAVIALAAIVFSLWQLVDSERAFSATLAVLVVTCPCALSLAVPTALSAATTQLARQGLLLGRLEGLETLNDVDRIVFDKTGTLSSGQAAISAVSSVAEHPHPLDTEALLAMVSAIEKHSNHPLAKAFDGFETPVAVEQVEPHPGQGLSAIVQGRRLRVGSPAFVADDSPAGANVVVADDDGILGRFWVDDQWREDAAAVIAQLQQRFAVEVFSGDQPSRVNDAQQQLGFTVGHGALLPEQKLARLRSLQDDGHTVLAIGDGVNDTALLAGADVSVALADGADLAQAGADVALLGQRLSPLLALFAIAERSQAIVRQNLAWAIAYNLLAVPIAALGLIGPALAALGMSLSSLAVVLNAARLARAPAIKARAQSKPAAMTMVAEAKA